MGRDANMPQVYASLILFVVPISFLLFDLFKDYLLVCEVFLVGPQAAMGGMGGLSSVPKALGTIAGIICECLHPSKGHIFISVAPVWLSKLFYLSPHRE